MLLLFERKQVGACRGSYCSRCPLNLTYTSKLYRLKIRNAISVYHWLHTTVICTKTVIQASSAINVCKVSRWTFTRWGETNRIATQWLLRQGSAINVIEDIKKKNLHKTAARFLLHRRCCNGMRCVTVKDCDLCTSLRVTVVSNRDTDTEQARISQ